MEKLLLHKPLPRARLAALEPASLPLSLCRRGGAVLCSSMGISCDSEHGMDQSADGTIWVARDGVILALPAIPRAHSDLLGHVRVNGPHVRLRGIDDVLASLFDARSGPASETVVLDGANDDMVGQDAIDGDRRHVRRLGPNGLSSWITDHPIRGSRWLIREVSSELEAVDARAR